MGCFCKSQTGLLCNFGGVPGRPLLQICQFGQFGLFVFVLFVQHLYLLYVLLRVFQTAWCSISSLSLTSSAGPTQIIITGTIAEETDEKQQQRDEKRQQRHHQQRDEQQQQQQQQHHPQLCHWKTAPNIVPGNWSTLDGGPVHSEGGFLFSEPFTNAIFTITIA